MREFCGRDQIQHSHTLKYRTFCDPEEINLVPRSVPRRTLGNVERNGLAGSPELISQTRRPLFWKLLAKTVGLAHKVQGSPIHGPILKLEGLILELWWH